MTHCLRITLGKINPQDVKVYLLKKTSLHIMCQEIGSQMKPHIHAVIAFTKVVENTFRQGLKTTFGLDGNSGFSLKKIQKDLHSSVRYCCKGEKEDRKPCILYNQPDYNVMELNKEFWDFVDKESVKFEVKEHLVNSNKPKTKCKTWSERTYDEIKMNTDACNKIRNYVNIPINVLTDGEKKMYNESRLVVYHIMMKCLGKGVKKLNDVIIGDLYRGFLNAIVYEDDEVGLQRSTDLYTKLFLIK